MDEIVCSIDNGYLVVFPHDGKPTGKTHFNDKFSFSISVDKARELIFQLQAAVDYHIQETKALEEYENNVKNL